MTQRALMICALALAMGPLGGCDAGSFDDAGSLGTAQEDLVVDGPMIGAYGGSSFYVSDPNAKIYGLTVFNGSYVDGITVYYQRPDGSTYGQHFGGWGGNQSWFPIYDGESLVSIGVLYGSWIDHLTLRTSWGRIGSFGGWGGSNTASVVAPTGAQVIGFHGMSGSYLNMIGFVTQSTLTRAL